jgi:hypothetical protein
MNQGEADTHDCHHRDVCHWGEKDKCVKTLMGCIQYRPEHTLMVTNEKTGGYPVEWVLTTMANHQG